MLANSKRNDKLREPPIRISEGRLLRIVQEEVAREVGRISDSRDLLFEATYENYTPKMLFIEKVPLKRGHGGRFVKMLQIALGVKVDGKFGPNTEKALAAAEGGKTEVDGPMLQRLRKEAGKDPKKKAAFDKEEEAFKTEALAAHKADAEAMKDKKGIETTKRLAKQAKEGMTDYLRGPYNLTADKIEDLWDQVSSKDRRRAEDDPTSAFIDGVKKIGGTDVGLVLAALYYNGGIKGKEDLDRQMQVRFKKDVIKVLDGERALSKNQWAGRFARWLAAKDRQKAMSAAGRIRSDYLPKESEEEEEGAA